MSVAAFVTGGLLQDRAHFVTKGLITGPVVAGKTYRAEASFVFLSGAQNQHAFSAGQVKSEVFRVGAEAQEVTKP